MEGRYVFPFGAVNVCPTERCSASTRGSGSTSARLRVERTRRCAWSQSSAGSASGSASSSTPAVGPSLSGSSSRCHPSAHCCIRRRRAFSAHVGHGLPSRPARDRHPPHVTGLPIGHPPHQRPHANGVPRGVVMHELGRDDWLSSDSASDLSYRHESTVAHDSDAKSAEESEAECLGTCVDVRGSAQEFERPVIADERAVILGQKCGW